MSNASVTPHLYSQYDNLERTERAIATGRHRNIIGGMWDEIGQLQLDFLKSRGLRPNHNFLDVGCGCLRAGVKVIPYLEPQRYYGIDAEKRLLDVGYNNELPKTGHCERLPRGNLFCSRLFKHDRLKANSIDIGICVSVITHLPLNFLRVCLVNLGTYFKPGGVLYLTFFEVPATHAPMAPYTNSCGIITSAFKDPYHYFRRDMEYMAYGTPWRAEYIGEWNHPRGQMMMAYQKI